MQGHLWSPGPVDSSLGPHTFCGCFFNCVYTQVPVTTEETEAERLHSEQETAEVERKPAWSIAALQLKLPAGLLRPPAAQVAALC